MKTIYITLCSLLLLPFGSLPFGESGEWGGWASCSAQVIAGWQDHSLFLCTDLTVRSCGANFYGHLGDGTTTQRITPVQVSGLTGITTVAGGLGHSLFVKNDGTAWACGRNADGQLGDGTGMQRTTPVQVSALTGITAVAGGYYHSLFLKNDNTVWACGGNTSGQLGDGTTTLRTSPVQVSGLTGITAVAAGREHSLFLKNDNTVWACGGNWYGQLGNNVSGVMAQPTPVLSGLTGITAISGGGDHSLFLKNDNTVWACGGNTSGQLGDGTTTNRTIPVQVSGLTGITAVAAGLWHSLFLKNDGTVWACGTNGSGQVGDGTTIQRTTPVQVSGLTGITAVAAGLSHSLFLKNDGTIWVCGYNLFGQLGDGTTTNRTIPVQVNACTPLLPIELLSFTAACQNNVVELKWSTATETNNDFFTVERTLNGFNYQLIGTVKGVGNSSTTQYYSLTDNELLPGITYYRLKQTDFNGQYEYFPFVAANCGKGIDIISIYPNPAIGETNIIVSSSELTGVTINLIDVLSRKVFSNTANAKQGNNTFTLDVSTLSSGSYMLQVVTESGLYRVQKQFVVK